MARSRPNSSFSLRAFSVRKNGSKGSQLPRCLSLFSRMSTNYRDCKVIRFFSENFWTSSVLVRQFHQAIFRAKSDNYGPKCTVLVRSFMPQKKNRTTKVQRLYGTESG